MHKVRNTDREMNFTERIAQITNGGSILADWIGHGAVPVSKELAQKRADICLKCPLNTTDWPVLESVADAIRQQVGLKNHLMLRVRGERDLHFCAACHCVNRLKIWLPLERIKPEPDEREKFHKNCWLLNEET